MNTKIHGAFWLIDAVIPANGRKVTLGNQEGITGKKVVTIFVSQNAKDENDNTLTKTGFQLSLRRAGKNNEDIPSDVFLDPNGNKDFILNDSTIEWNKSFIVFPATNVSVRYVQLVVIYEDNE